MAGARFLWLTTANPKAGKALDGSIVSSCVTWPLVMFRNAIQEGPSLRLRSLRPSIILNRAQPLIPTPVYLQQTSFPYCVIGISTGQRIQSIKCKPDTASQVIHHLITGFLHMQAVPQNPAITTKSYWSIPPSFIGGLEGKGIGL